MFDEGVVMFRLDVSFRKTIKIPKILKSFLYRKFSIRTSSMSSGNSHLQITCTEGR